MSERLGVKRVCVTGSRWAIAKHRNVIRQALEDYMPFEVLVHGNGRGVDRIAAQIAKELGVKLEPHPADWSKHGRAAGPLRNREMAESDIECALAFPLAGHENRGTWDCVRHLVENGVHVWVTPLAPLTENEASALKAMRSEP